MAKQRFQVTINEELVRRAFAHIKTDGFNSLSEYLEHLIREAHTTTAALHDDAASSGQAAAAQVVAGAVADVKAAAAAKARPAPAPPAKYPAPRRSKK